MSSLFRPTVERRKRTVSQCALDCIWHYSSLIFPQQHYTQLLYTKKWERYANNNQNLSSLEHNSLSEKWPQDATSKPRYKKQRNKIRREKY